MNQPRVAVLPTDWVLATDAIEAGGGKVVPLADAEALVWIDWHGVTGLTDLLAHAPDIRWVHLPGAGVEEFIEAGLTADGRVWTCGKGAHSALIAEHALALALAGLHRVPSAARATTWGRSAVTSLFDQPVTILGGGGIATALITLLSPLRCAVTVVRRRSAPVPGALRTIGIDELGAGLGDARLVVLALALTAQTRGVIGRSELELMNDHAWLVNVSRGGHVDTDALVHALRMDLIGGAALDVTDPEPLPEGHPLWSLPNCVITPHIAGASAAAMKALVDRIADNVRLFNGGQPLLGLVDSDAGY
jgi:phosphoglycerate dehydrogenase-like enzyme